MQSRAANENPRNLSSCPESNFLTSREMQVVEREASGKLSRRPRLPCHPRCALAHSDSEVSGRDLQARGRHCLARVNLAASHSDGCVADAVQRLFPSLSSPVQAHQRQPADSITGRGHFLDFLLINTIPKLAGELTRRRDQLTVPLRVLCPYARNRERPAGKRPNLPSQTALIPLLEMKGKAGIIK